MSFINLFKYKGDILRKLWLNQFAFSLFGLFVASPFSGGISIVAGVFSYLFYLSVVGYSVLDDAQKDKISHNAGRITNVTAFTGIKYAFVAFLPTIILTGVYTILTFIPDIDNSITFIISLITRFVMGGEILGIDTGLTNYMFDPTTNTLVIKASETVLFISSHGFIHLLYSVITPVIIGLIYFLAFKGIISINTTDVKKNK